MPPWPLVTGEQMRALDAHTIDTLGVPGDVLMESAGRAVVEAVLELASLASLASVASVRSRAVESVIVVCGSGNNGGDGYVVARHLAMLGVAVRTVSLSDPSQARGDAALNVARAQRLGVPDRVGADGIEAASLAGSPATARATDLDAHAGELIVDAIFGTGLRREVAPDSEAGRAILAIEARRARGARVVAVDIPSGLDADTGQPLGCCVAADVTVAIGLPKCGLVLEPGRSLAGRVLVARIGIADAAPGVRAGAERFDRTLARAALPARPRTAHKGRFGHVLVIAGSQGKTGAAALAARAAARSGAGLVTLACPAGLNDILETLCTEAMTAPVADTPERGFAASAEDALLGLAHERDVVALGPGLGRSADTDALVRSFAKRCERPLVLDADALNALQADVSLLRGRSAPTLLTPHPGEAARLLATSAEAINRDRIGAARELAARSGAIVVLKGAPTVTATPEGFVSVNSTGGPALGSGGTGDVLTGLLAGLLAQGAAPEEAGALAAWIHGEAGDRIAAAQGDAGLLAGDLADALPATLRDLRDPARDGTASARTVRGLLLDLSDA